MKTLSKNFPSTLRPLGLALLAILVSPVGLAGEDGWYGGASVGQSREMIDFAAALRAALPAGVTLSSYSDDDTDNGYKVFGGYQFNQHFALEGGYFNLGDWNYRSTTNPAGSQSGNFNAEGFNIDLVGILPITAKLSALGRIGMNYGDTSSTLTGTGVIPAYTPTINDSNSNAKYGLGLQYAVNSSFDIRLEAERYRLQEATNSKGDVDLVSLGVVYRFGAKPVPVAPPVVVAAPKPTPAPAPTPPPAPRKISFSADSLFGFDQSAVQPAGKVELDKLAADLKGTSFDVITVTGHSDRIGNEAYNLKLSQKRADAVKAYLVQNGGIAAAKITARGVDGSNPITKPNDCKGTGSTAALISCLQPDRRVEVEVTATK